MDATTPTPQPGSGPGATGRTSGDDVPVTPADALPHPALWGDPPAGEQPHAFQGTAEEHADVPRRTRRRELLVYGSVALICLGAVLLGIAVVTATWPTAVVGVLLGLGGGSLALRERIFAAVSVGQSPTGPG